MYTHALWLWAGAIGFTGRSDDRHISTFDDLSLDRTKVTYLDALTAPSC